MVRPSKYSCCRRFSAYGTGRRLTGGEAYLPKDSPGSVLDESRICFRLSRFPVESCCLVYGKVFSRRQVFTARRLFFAVMPYFAAERTFL